MRQILLTIKNPGIQQEVKDFLAECFHSPQWIGDTKDWEIRSFYFRESISSVGKRKDRFITALLESESAGNVVAIPLTVGQIYDALSFNRNLNLSVGYRKGLRGRIETFDYAEVTSFINNKGSYVLCFKSQNNHPQTRVENLFDVLNVRVFDAIRNEHNLNNIDDICEYVAKSIELQYLKDNPESIEFLTNAPVLVQVADGASGNPLTEVVIENDRVVLIYNQDVVIE